MLAKPKLKTVTLLSPLAAAPVTLARAVTSTSSSPFEGQPDPNSPAQRTLSQALANRLVGQSNVYHWLREYAFRTVWGFQPETVPGVTVTLAIAHQSHGPKFAVVVKNAQWSTSFGERLVDNGWHVLIVDSTNLVQAPQEAISDILTVLHHYAGLPFGTGELPATDARLTGGHTAVDARDFRQDGDRSRPELKKPVKLPRRQASRLPVLAVLSVLAMAAAGLYILGDQVPGTLSWRKGSVYTTKVASVQVTKEGHAAVTLGDGRKGFVPARSVKNNPNLLHELIVAWRQGRTLSVFTTSTQHLRYGREMGIKIQAKPSAAKKAH